MDQAGERGVEPSIDMEGTLCDQVPPASNPIYVLGRAQQETLLSPSHAVHMQMYNSKSDRGCLSFMNYLHDFASSNTESSIIIVSSVLFRVLRVV